MAKKIKKCTDPNCDGYIYYGSGCSVQCDCVRKSKNKKNKKLKS